MARRARGGGVRRAGLAWELGYAALAWQRSSAGVSETRRGRDSRWSRQGCEDMGCSWPKS